MFIDGGCDCVFDEQIYDGIHKTEGHDENKVISKPHYYLSLFDYISSTCQCMY